MSVSSPLQVGVAGIGFGSTEFLPILERMPGIQLVAAADLRPHALQAFEKRYGAEAMELYDAVRGDKPMLHDGRWGMATVEVQLALIESAAQRREILLRHQVPVPPGW